MLGKKLMLALIVKSQKIYPLKFPGIKHTDALHMGAIENLKDIAIIANPHTSSWFGWGFKGPSISRHPILR